MRTLLSQALAVVCLTALPVAGQQASITLKNSDVQFCNKQDVAWTLTKTVNPTGEVASGTPVSFSINATKGSPGPKTICALGYVEVANTGSANATIGNIVVNLQRQRLVNSQNRWVSASVDVANAFAGDAATQVKIVASASQEDAGWNALYNPDPNQTYTTSGPVGTFKENAGSGTLVFTDADSNSIWAIQPQKTIAPGTSVKLFFNATFKNDVLQIPDGTSLRTEVIVTFGNSGARGGSGASGSSIDIDGDGNPEQYVRSVPTRLTRNLPATTICNNSVTFNDTFSTTGSGGYTTPNWDPFLSGTLPVTLTDSASWTVTTIVTGPGTVSNTATLKSDDTFVNVTVGIDPLTGLPITTALRCCSGVDLQASATVSVLQPAAPAYCTETHFENNSPQARAEMALYPTAFSGGLTIGTYNPGNGNTAPNGFTWTGNTAGAAKLKDFVTGGGSGGVITADALNPDSGSGGPLARHTVTLTLNIGFGGVIPNWITGFGSLTVYGTGTWADGKTANQVLQAANAALADGTLPTGATTFQDVSSIVDSLNKAFNNCQQSAWAAAHLQ